MNYRKLVDVAVLAGEIMLASGAETYRVEDTMRHILNVSGLEAAEAIVTGMAISISLADEKQHTISLVKRIDKRETDLGKVYRVNTVSRKFCNSAITLEEAHEELREIKRVMPYNRFQKFLANIGTIMFFAVLLGGTYYDFAFAVINGLIVALCILGLDAIKMNQFFTNVIGAFAVALFSTFVLKVLEVPITLDVVISGSILPLLPGVAITNAIRDTLQGDYMSGGARAMEAIVMAAGISIGIGLGLSILK